MWLLLRKWIISLTVLLLVSVLISYLIGDEPIFVVAIWLFFGLIVIGWLLGISSALSNIINYKLFGDDIANRLADTLLQAGGLPKPDKFALDIDDYLLQIRNSEDSPRQEALLASELIGLRDGMKSSGQYTGLYTNSKILEKAILKLHSD